MSLQLSPATPAPAPSDEARADRAARQLAACERDGTLSQPLLASILPGMGAASLLQYATGRVAAVLAGESPHEAPSLAQVTAATEHWLCGVQRAHAAPVAVISTLAAAMEYDHLRAAIAESTDAASF